MKLTGNDLKEIGFTEGKALGLALQVMEKHYELNTVREKLAILKGLLENPSLFEGHSILAPIAGELLRPTGDIVALAEKSLPYQIYGVEAIEQGALQQMDTAMRS